MRTYNVVVLGAGGVGKSALTVRFMRDEFAENYDPTIEEVYRRTMTVNGEIESVEVLDTAGAEQFTSLKEVYMKNGRGFLLVFSLTQETTLQEVDNLRKQIVRERGPKAPIVIVGTKLDLSSEREVPRAVVQALSGKWDMPFYETSAKRNWHINDAFNDLIRQMQRQGYGEEKKAVKKTKEGPCRIM